MRDLNKVFLIGRLGKDPLRRETKNGTSVTHFPLATSRWIRSLPDAEGNTEVREETQWHKVVVWGKQGDACVQYLKKGNPIHVEGSVRSHKYKASDGGDRYAFEIIADSVSFLAGAEKTIKIPQELVAEAS